MKLKPKKSSVFTKIFAYTMFLLVLMSLAAVAVFAPQFLSFYRAENQRQLAGVFQPMVRQFEGKSPDEVAHIARVFYDKNQSFRFIVKDDSGDVLFSSPDAEESERFQLMLGFTRGADTEQVPEPVALIDELPARSRVQNVIASADASTITTVHDELPARSRVQNVIASADASTITTVHDELPARSRVQNVIASADASTITTVHDELPARVQVQNIVTSTAHTIATVKIQENTYTVLSNTVGSVPVDYGTLAGKTLLALLSMIAIGVLGAVLFARKVTKPLEDELARERVMEENQRLFFSAASHELKTPIAATEALVEGMIANIGDYKNHPKYLRECLKNLDSQNRLVSEILELVKLSDDQAAPLLVPLSLAELGDSLIAEYRPLAEQRGITISADFPVVAVRADRNLLHRALSNVIANAVQNTPENEAIRIGVEQWEHHIRLSVLNTGAYIPDEFLCRLFEPFYRPDPARSRNHARSGLGLTIVKKSLNRMGIPFALENTSEGVLFWLDMEASL